PADVAVTFTRTSQLAAPAASAAPVTVMVPAAAETNAGLFASAPPAGQLDCTLGVPATATPAGSVSVKLMPDCAGLVPLLVIVNTSVEVPPASMVDATNAFARLGFARVTTRHWSVAMLLAPIVVTLAAALVKAAAGQDAFTCVAALVSPETVTVQLAVPLVIAMPVRPESTRVPAVYVAVVGPEHPAE